MNEINKKDIFQQKAEIILEIVQRIFDYQQEKNPYAIRKDNEYFKTIEGEITGIIKEDQAEYLEYRFSTEKRDGFKSVAKDGYENKGMHGIIKKRINHYNIIPSEYAIETALEFEPDLWFARLSIKYPKYRDSDIIELKGQWYGPKNSYHDEDLLNILKEEELNSFLDQIQERLTKMYQEMLINVDLFDDEDILKIKKYVKTLANKRKMDNK